MIAINEGFIESASSNAEAAKNGRGLLLNLPGRQAEPRIRDEVPGYGGRYPGIVEEAWRSLEAKKPLYVAGGFGGAAALVAELVERKAIPAELQDGTFAASKYFRDTNATVENDPSGL